MKKYPSHSLMNFNRVSFLFMLSLMNSIMLSAQSDQWTPEEIINTVYVSNPEFSHDGSLVVWSQRKGLKKEDKFVNDFYLARLNSLKNGKPSVVQLTNTNDNDHSPIFDRDGENLYFLSTRKKGKSLWRLSMLGGEPKEINEFENGISNLSWLNESTLLFVSGEGKTYYDIENEKDNTQIIEDTAHWNPTRIYSFNTKTKKISRITHNKYKIGEYAVSKDGEFLVYRLTTSPDFGVDGNSKHQYYLKDLSTGREQQILKGMQSPFNFQFTESGSGFYFLATLSSNPEWEGAGIEELYFYSLEENNFVKVPLDWENGVAYQYFLSGENVIAQMANGPLKKVSIYNKVSKGWSVSDFGIDPKKKEHVTVMGVSSSGNKLVYNYSTASSLPEYFVMDIDIRKKSVATGKEVELISLNNKLKKKKIAKSEVVYWTGALDEKVSGILYYPKNYKEGEKYPLILSIHGGPTGVDQDSWSERWSTYPQIYTDKGAFVLKPNYHGSGQHNLEFVESIKNGNYYHLEQIDLYNGILALQEKGMVDMDKLGLMGWSNGAILATWMTLKYPDMFKVAAPGAGDINWTSDYGTCRFGVTFDQSYFGGAPWDDTNGKHFNEWYINNSPIFEIEKIKTPTIIFHGSEDRSVPRDQGWEYYRGLQQVGVAPVKFLWFPGQPHGLQKITHQLRKMKEEIKWIDQYLFEKEDDKNEAFKEDSPLASQILAQKNKNAGYYGLMEGGKLVPEMVSVKTDSISISKFEVTIAQYYASLGKEVPENQGNMPVTGLSQQEIENYLSWLKKTTGKVYRLPNEKEAKKLHESGRKGYKNQNNLNYWAGYALTEQDVVDLKSKLATEQVDLLKPVGSFPYIKVGKAKVFDIGGNVCEYYLEGKTLKAYDYGATEFVDPFKPEVTSILVDKSNTGFRLVLP